MLIHALLGPGPDLLALVLDSRIWLTEKNYIRPPPVLPVKETSMLSSRHHRPANILYSGSLGSPTSTLLQLPGAYRQAAVQTQPQTCYLRIWISIWSPGNSQVLSNGLICLQDASWKRIHPRNCLHRFCPEDGGAMLSFTFSPLFPFLPSLLPPQPLSSLSPVQETPCPSLFATLQKACWAVKVRHSRGRGRLWVSQSVPADPKPLLLPL